MTVTADWQRELETLLGQEIETAKRLLDILEREHAAVADRDVDDLEQIIIAKQSRIGDFEDLMARHESILTTAGYRSEQSPLEHFLARAGATSGLTNLWQQLRGVITQCNDQNQRNARLVALQRRKTEHALNILRGQGPGSESYGPDGTALPGAVSRPLISV